MRWSLLAFLSALFIMNTNSFPQELNDVIRTLLDQDSDYSPDTLGSLSLGSAEATQTHVDRPADVIGHNVEGDFPSSDPKVTPDESQIIKDANLNLNFPPTPPIKPILPLSFPRKPKCIGRRIAACCGGLLGPDLEADSIEVARCMECTFIS